MGFPKKAKGAVSSWGVLYDFGFVTGLGEGLGMGRTGKEALCPIGRGK